MPGLYRLGHKVHTSRSHRANDVRNGGISGTGNAGKSNPAVASIPQLPAYIIGKSKSTSTQQGSLAASSSASRQFATGITDADRPDGSTDLLSSPCSQMTKKPWFAGATREATRSSRHLFGLHSRAGTPSDADLG